LLKIWNSHKLNGAPMGRQCFAQTNCNGALANKDLVGKWVLPGCASEAPEKVDFQVSLSCGRFRIKSR
jgi:hypothetical protein